MRFFYSLFFPLLVCATCPVRNAHDQPVTGWPVEQTFTLRADYPLQLPEDSYKPWLQFDFKSDWQSYLKAVLGYVLEGNEDQGVDWYAQRNLKRHWYHALWMDRSNSGREFVHGLTRERTPREHEILPFSKGNTQSWAISAYNDVGAYTLGQVWKNPCDPDLSKAKFYEGAVAYKLIFTTATPNQFPFLKNTKTWKAQVWESVDQSSSSDIHALKNTKQIQRVQQPLDVFLIQLDVAVRDSRASETGWVFGTFVYRSDAPGTSVFDRMVPAALQWGNVAALKSGFSHTSVLNDEAYLAVYFRNIQSGELFDAATLNAKSLHYSLQIQVGVERMCEAFKTSLTGTENQDLLGLPTPIVCLQ